MSNEPGDGGPGPTETVLLRPVEFALTPAQAVRDLYDYKTTKDAKIYKMATDPLLTKHNGTVATLRPMLDELLMRVKDFNWNSIVTINDDNGKPCNVILQNRALTMTNVADSAAAYLGTHTRMAQDNYLMVQCILNSLDADGSKALRSSQYSYNQNGEPCAAILVKVLLLDCEVETASTNFYVRAQLGDLEQHMVSIDYDVISFNKHVSELLRKLRQGGEESHDDVLFIYMHVMRAYLICPDPDFLLAIKLQKISGEADPKLLTLPTLMIAAQKTYQTLLQEGTYNAPQSHESRLVALAAKYNHQSGNNTRDGNGVGKTKIKERPKKPEWMGMAPTDGITNKTVDGKHYHFCSFHKRWGFHKEADCYVRMRQTQQQQPSQSANAASTRSVASVGTSLASSLDASTTRLTMSAAIAAVLDDNDDDSGSYAAFTSVIAAPATSNLSKLPPPSNKSVATFDSDSFTILVDNGASRCMTNNAKHFVGSTRSVSKQVTGLGAGTVTLEGTVRWSWEDDQGKIHHMEIPNTLYCSELAFCLLSPQHLATERQDNFPIARGTWLATYADAMVLQWGQRQYQRTIPLSSTNAFVGIMRSAPGFRKSTKFLNLCALALPSTPLCFPAPLFHIEAAATSPTVSAPATFVNDTEENYNWVLQQEASIRHEPLRFDFDPDRTGEPPTVDTTFDSSTLSSLKVPTDPTTRSIDAARHELLTLHHRLGHMPFAQIRHMLRVQQFPNTNLFYCPLPVCSACLFAKAVRRAWRTKHSAATLKIATTPGEIVSLDQLESSTPGLIAHSKGHPTTKRFTCATVFVDHHSRLTYVHMQESNNAIETLAAKHAFEVFARSHQVTVLQYHGDNGRFADNAFRADCAAQGQILSFCGVNAHFQNGIAERKIRDLQDRARTMLVHAKHRWPAAITSNLWPYALRLANESSRCIPLPGGTQNPMQLFTGHASPLNHHQLLHPFGCPMYVLKSAPASGKKGSKWGERARCGVYLGLSPEHARSVCLVLSLTTGLVSAQFHVRADEQFETVGSSSNETSPTSPAFQSLWQIKHGFAPARTVGVPGRRSVPPARGSTRLSNRPAPARQIKTAHRAPDHLINRLPAPAPAPPPAPAPADSDSSDDDEPPLLLDRADIRYEAVDVPAPPAPPAALGGGLPLPAVVTPLPALPTVADRPRRTTRPPRRLIASAAPLVPSPVLMSVTDPQQQDLPASLLSDLGEFVLQDTLQDPIAFSASADPDTMYLHEARRQPDWPQFQLAMQEEVRAHENRHHWKLIRRSAVPHGVSVLPSVWSMKRKRRIATREIYKWKARLTVHGGKQVHGINFWETYAPVVNWTSIRLHLILALLNGHHTRQIDFVLAYPQADIECDMYMEIPQGFHHEGQKKTHVLKLLKNIYGTRQAGRVWNKHIHAGLIERGYRQSDIDHCVYYKENTVFLLYVDDGIFIGPDSEEIAKLILSLKHDPLYATAYDITDEGTLSDYLGVKIDHLEGGRMLLSQPHLIQQILDDLGFKDNTKSKNTPAPATTILHRDINGKEFEEEWAYRSVIGKLNFLEKSTRGDLSYAVHQCARFSICPKHSHAEAVRHIGRYLIGTKDKGIILNPTHDSFDCYVDADFCGTWNPDTAEGDSSTSKSRTGYVIKYAGCPIVWQSKLQTETALSTTEAEYVALSSALREVIGLMGLLKEAQKHGIPNVTHTPTIHCKVFEDNSGALTMAQIPKMRPRTKHLNVKYHHFRDHVARGDISLHPVASANQEADIYTKPLPLTLFARFRLAIFGW